MTLTRGVGAVLLFIATLATSPYFASLDVDAYETYIGFHVDAILGVGPWLFAHPVRLIAVVPAVLFLVSVVLWGPVMDA